MAPDSTHLHHGDEATEQTPLLTENSSSSSSTLEASSPRPEDQDVPNYAVSRLRGLAVSASLFILIFIQTSNMSGMTLIQGQVADDLQAYENAMWMTTAFFIPTSSLSPLWGRFGTIFPIRVLVIPMALFMAAGSFVCSRATAFVPFIVGRVLSGIAGGAVLSLSIIIVLELTTKRRRGLFIGLVNAGFTSGVAVGAVVYGAALPVIGWRPLFWIQTPVSLVAGLALYLSLPVMSVPGKQVGTIKDRLFRIDYLGALLLTLTIVLFLYALAGEIQAWPMIASLGGLIAFLLVEYFFASDPIIPLKVLSDRTVVLACLAQLGFVSARWSVLFYAPIYILSVRGSSPAVAGSVIVPTNIAFGLTGLAVGLMHLGRGSLWLPTLTSLAVFTASLYGLSLVAGTDPAHTSLVVLIVVIMINGAGTGAGFNLSLSHVLNLSHRDVEYVSSALLGTFRGFGGSFGSAIGGGVYTRILRSTLVKGFLELGEDANHLSPHRQKLVNQLVASPAMVHHGGLDPAEQQIAVNGYITATSGLWRSAAILGLIVILIQAGTARKAPKDRDENGDITEEERNQARASANENEGVGET